MKIYNTLSGRKEDFVTEKPNCVNMYVCGVTPYSDAHLGHAMSYIIFDTVRRYLKYKGYQVKYVQNVTDIDDKIINRANEQGISIDELATRFTDSYYDDMDKLNVAKPDETPRATEVIPDMIKVISGLVEKGFAYPSQGSVYFRVRKVEDYGKLSHHSPDSLRSGSRIESGDEKEDPLDFVLWKGAKPGEPSWESPWGAGRPGWHIECSVMSLTHLGETLDIHGGGHDLIFPHHENEIAQSESYTGVKPFAKYWMHNGLVQMGGEKMSKSLGNLISIKEALTRYSADGLRVFVLNSHYRSPLTYSEEIIEAADKGAERLTMASNLESPKGTPQSYSQEGKELSLEAIRQVFEAFMDDDFNTPGAIALLFNMARAINQGRDDGKDVSELQKLLKELGGILGLGMEAMAEGEIGTAEPFVELLITVRKEMRTAKQFQLADMIRDKLDELGIVMEDTPQGTTWKQKR